MVYVKGPGLYSDIGKKARDLLYRDYQADRKFTLSTLTSNGVAITSSGTQKDDLFLADISTLLKNKNITTDLKVDTSSNVFTTVTVDEPAPGVKAIFSFVSPDQKSGKVELQYLHEYAGISTSLGFTAKPTVNFSGVAGNHQATVGTDISFNTATGNFTKLNGGISLISTDLIASLMVNDKGQSVTASYFHMVSLLTNTTVGAEFTHGFKSHENTLTFGAHHMMDLTTAVKARVNNYGKVNALLQHEWRPRSLITISGEVDTRAIEKSAKIGLAVAIRP
ncbi:mitochondrial outer membrane protein porin of 36 kDa-like [Salvia splendens]|uniref:mitochondrial outer membrane protein porin of 36 kDa-like n=1 Tax=Salvia splendens TaxID=180675 RepID=UPI001C252177|nr:mitochondrial outer membrane protein porin of 36 kDa-like [Salvia splendens]